MGSVVGFSGRDLTNSDNFKYVNSKSSEIFDKSQALYNIDQAKYTAKKTNMLFLVEGQFDVIAMVQKGYSNTVAISGTAFTTKHLNIINRMITDTGKVVLCLDGDKAGQKAALKIFKEHPSIQSRLYLIILPDNKDPCEYLQENEHLPQPIKLLDFLFNSLRKKYPPNILENRQKFIEQLQENITQYITDSSLKEIYLKTACSMVGISYNELKQKSFNFIEYNNTKTAQQDDSTKLSKEDLLYIKSLAIYIKHLMILPLINYNDYPKKYANFISEVIKIVEDTKTDETIKIIPELFQNKKLISLIIQVDVNKLDDPQLAQDYYLNILKLAQEETKKDSINKKRIDIINSVQDMDSKQFLEYLHIKEQQGG